MPRGNLRDLEIKMIVVAASGIEVRTACRTAGITLHVLKNGQDCAAGAAKHSWLLPFALWPDCYRMIGERLVAVLASVVQAATFHLDGDNVRRPVIVRATGLRIEIYATHAWRGPRHRFSLADEKAWPNFRP